MQHLFLNIDPEFLDRVFYHEKVSSYIWFVGIIGFTLLLKKPVARLLTRASTSLAQKYSFVKHNELIMQMLFQPMERLVQVILYFIASERLGNVLASIDFRRLATSQKSAYVIINLSDLVDHIFLFLFVICLTQVVTKFIDFVYYLRLNKARDDKNISGLQLLPLIREVSKLVAWTLSVFWILGGVFHVNIPALITGLGIGGIAIALAGKETVENFFAAFTIFSDKPFQAGDYIKLAEMEGTVERIGFRSTRLRHIDGSEIIIPNQHLVGQNLVNQSTRETMGMKVSANIRYGLTPSALKSIVDEIVAELPAIVPVGKPITAIIEAFDKETLHLVVSYLVPHPLPAGQEILQVKNQVNMKVFEIINRYAALGVPDPNQ